MVEQYWENQIKNMKILILLIMLFLHIVDDYYLQGIEHGFSWTFMVMLPFTFMMLYYNNYSMITTYIVMFIGNWVIHSLVDHLKANVKVCSLIVDQLIHVAQVISIWIIMMYT